MGRRPLQREGSAKVPGQVSAAPRASGRPGPVVQPSMSAQWAPKGGSRGPPIGQLGTLLSPKPLLQPLICPHLSTCSLLESSMPSATFLGAVGPS